MICQRGSMHQAIFESVAFLDAVFVGASDCRKRLQNLRQVKCPGGFLTNEATLIAIGDENLIACPHRP